MLLRMDTVWLEAECSRYEFFCDVVSQSHPDVGIVSIDENPSRAISLIEQLRDMAGPHLQRRGRQQFERW